MSVWTNSEVPGACEGHRAQCGLAVQCVGTECLCEHAYF